MPLSVALILAGLLLVVGVLLQRRRLQMIYEDTDFYAQPRSFWNGVWFHLVVAPFYMALVMPFQQKRFRQRTHSAFAHPHSMSWATFIARYAAHFALITLLLLGLGMLALQSRDPSILTPARLGAIALLLYAFYWKWLFSSLILPVALGLQILAFATGGPFAPMDLATSIFMLAFDEIFSAEIALIYVYTVIAAVLGSVAFDVVRLFEPDFAH